MDSLGLLRTVHPSWKPYLDEALQSMDSNYITDLVKNKNWLPGLENIFNAFTLPLTDVNYVLFGESPYPRKASANGYAFWDANVQDLWSSSGLSKQVNRATSLRNIIKTLLIAEGLLSPQTTTQAAIAAIDKKHLIQTNQALFTNLLNHGFLLLNASLVLSDIAVQKEAKYWQPFLKHILLSLIQQRPHITLILFGKIANQIDSLIGTLEIKRLYAEHPYNLSFITNSDIIHFFKPFHLLRKTDKLKLLEKAEAARHADTTG